MREAYASGSSPASLFSLGRKVPQAYSNSVSVRVPGTIGNGVVGWFSIYRTEPSDENAIFSILIPTWNNLDLLKICVESIEKNSYFKHQIIIHVNEGNDGTLEWVKAANYYHTQSDSNVGICYSLNALAKLATTNYILYINDDMYVCPNWDKYLMDAIQEQEDDNFYFSGLD